MNRNAKDKQSRMLAKDTRKLAKLIPGLMAHYGLLANPDPRYAGVYAGRSKRFDCALEVHPHPDNNGHPWLACCFHRPDPRPDLPWNAPENSRKYRDIAQELGGNDHSGKCNTHIFDRVSAREALCEFERHLRSLIGDHGSPWFTDSI